MFPFFNRYPGTDLHEIDLAYILKLCEALESDNETFKAWKETHEAQYAQLKQLYDDILAGNFPDNIKEAFNTWMRYNAADIVGEMIKMVFFELSDTGYFVAYIPDSWDDITFNTTGLDITLAIMPDFGHLVLSY